MRVRFVQSIVAAMLLLAAVVGRTDTAGEEIEFLLDAVATSGCRFVRNGKSHDATRAAAHLRMKYRRARRHAQSAEQFIARLASKSSITGKSYTLRCADRAEEKTGDWLQKQLALLRDR